MTDQINLQIAGRETSGTYYLTIKNGDVSFANGGEMPEALANIAHGNARAMRLELERATSAEQAIKIMEHYLPRYQSGRYNGLCSYIVEEFRPAVSAALAGAEHHVAVFLSTAHVSAKTRDWLNEQAEKCAQGDESAFDAGRNRYGWFFYCGETAMTDATPEDVQKIAAKVRAQGHNYVVLDRDSDTVEGLPTYDW